MGKKARARESEARELRMLDEARSDVVHADQKASILLAALGVGFGLIVGGQFSGDFDPGALSTVAGFVWWSGVASASIAIALAAAAVWPRYTLDDEPEYGITYWGHIADFPELSDLEDALDLEPPTSKVRTRHQLWRLSRLVLTKYRLVKLALAFGGSAATLIFTGSALIP